ncbi:MAG: hypothetical protein ACJ76L_02670 [Conexibacter sp.]
MQAAMQCSRIVQSKLAPQVAMCFDSKRLVNQRLGEQLQAIHWKDVGWRHPPRLQQGGMASRAWFFVGLTFLVLGFGVTPAIAATWSVQTGAAATGDLRDVSCISSTRCTAVGETGTSRGLIEVWDGSSWRLQEAAIPRETVRMALLAVSCTSERFCVAAGYYRLEAGSVFRPLVETWNGTAWSATTAFSPQAFDDVSCSSERGCTVVGEGWVYRWNGTEWRTQSGTGIAGSISCKSETSCIAVGDEFNESFAIVPAAWSWNGTSWRRTTVSAPASARGLYNLSCSSSSFCMSISPATENFSERWNGSEWRQSTVPIAPLFASNALSCTATTFCAGMNHTTAAYWNGTEWSTETLPAPEGTERAAVGISCTSSTACTLVGRYKERGGSFVPLIERYS